MILRKPYAFLIKHFQQINALLLLLIIFVLFKNSSLSGFVRDYMATSTYNPMVDPISNYIGWTFYVAIFLIIIIAIILAGLLSYKKKPYMMYLMVIAEYIFMLIAFTFAGNYFKGDISAVVNLQQIRIVRDLLFISSLPQYVFLIVLVIRTLGIDIKKFGFREDEEYAEITSEDDAEFEVSLEFDKDAMYREFRRKLRFFKYFLIENKIILSIVLTVFLLLGSGSLYYYAYIVNRVYSMNEWLSFGNFDFKITEAYLTNKNYRGDVFSKEDKYYLVLDLSVMNKTGDDDTRLPNDKFLLITDKNYYNNVLRYDEEFHDLGTGYQDQKLTKGKLYDFILVYEIDPSDLGNQFVLYYQKNNTGVKAEIEKIIIDTKSVSYVDLVASNTLKEEVSIPLYDGVKLNQTINSYSFNDSFEYRYESCYVRDCTTKTALVSASDNNTILRLYVKHNGSTGLAYTNTLSKYGTLGYNVEGVDKKIKINSILKDNWRGNYAYLEVPKEVETSEVIYIDMIVRDKIYRYYLKGDAS